MSVIHGFIHLFFHLVQGVPKPLGQQVASHIISNIYLFARIEYLLSDTDALQYPCK